MSSEVHPANVDARGENGCVTTRAFASDNFAGAHPAVIDALSRANDGHAMAYGADPHTARAIARLHEMFGNDTEVFFVFGGTGGNVVALSTLVGPGDSVICSQWSHIHVDETGAPERMGVKLVPMPSTNGKITPDDIREAASVLGTVHHAQPRVVSITQPTELGTLYSATEVAELCEVAHSFDMLVHMDGARFANACAALGGGSTARSFSVDAGVDVLTFGGTKNGLVFGEAVLYFTGGAVGSSVRAEALRRAVRYAPYARKHATQLPSKMRFVSAQFDALLADDLWVRLAGQANAAARRLFDGVSDIASLELHSPPDVNSLYPILEPAVAATLRETSFFWDWDPAAHRFRWMTAWDTQNDDVDAFVGAVRAATHFSNG
jgi:threonine aldolase